MFDIKRNDESFNLDKVSNEELFEGLKSDVVNAIKEITRFENLTDSNIKLCPENCFRTHASAEDGNLYPKISLATTIKIPNELGVINLIFVISPFDIKLLLCDFGLKVIVSKKLDDVVSDFIKTKFPNSDYDEKKQKYLKLVEISNKIYNNMIFEK